MDPTATTLTELRCVVAIAETGHVGPAASRCHGSRVPEGVTASVRAELAHRRLDAAPATLPVGAPGRSAAASVAVASVEAAS